MPLRSQGSGGYGIPVELFQILKDVATVRRVPVDEPSKVMRINGQRGVVLALSPVPNGDVIKMGKEVHERVGELMKLYPAGYHVDTVSYQPDNVNVAIHAFTKNLREAIIIVTRGSSRPRDQTQVSHVVHRFFTV